MLKETFSLFLKSHKVTNFSFWQHAPTCYRRKVCLSNRMQCKAEVDLSLYYVTGKLSNALKQDDQLYI